MQTNAALALTGFALATIAAAVPEGPGSRAGGPREPCRRAPGAVHDGPRNHTVFSAGQISFENFAKFPWRTADVFFEPNGAKSAVGEKCPLNEELNLHWGETSGKWKLFATTEGKCVDINVHEDNATAVEFDSMHGNTTEFGQILSKDSDNGAYLWYGSKKSEPERVYTVAAVDTERKYFIFNTCGASQTPQHTNVHVYVREGAITDTLKEQIKEDLRANDEKTTSTMPVYLCPAPAQPEQ